MTKNRKRGSCTHSVVPLQTQSPFFSTDVAIECITCSVLSYLGWAQAGVIKFYKRKWQACKRTFEYDYCCKFVITDLIQLVLLPELSDVIHFLREVDAHPLHSAVSLDGVSQTMMACIEAWVKRLEEPSVHLKEVDAFTIVLEQIATALQQLVPSSLPTHIQPNGHSTGHAQSSTETKETL